MTVACNVVRINGSLPGGEVWSVNPRFFGNFGPDITNYPDLLAWATNIAALNSGNVLPAPLRALLSPSGAVVSIRCEYRDASDRLQQAAEVALPSPAPGTGSATKPFQTSLVSSLLTGRPGRSYRGRLYWPALGAIISASDLRLSDVNAQSYCTAVGQFLTAVQNAAPAGTGVTLGVVSQTLSTRSAVTRIEVGDVLDVQRRRRDSLVEGRFNASFPTA